MFPARSSFFEINEIGNPLSYRDGMSFTWENGRWLKSTTLEDKTNISYSYNSSGIRTEKTVGNVTTEYYYDKDNNLIGLTKGNDVLFFYYDTDGSPQSMSYNGTMYYYVKNLQGDVVKIINQAGTEVANYIYDAWGNIKSVSGDPVLKELNPFRYRGYVYDDETGLYYLQSRYYDPEIGRCITADVVISGSAMVGANLYAYCYNNPIIYYYDDGFLPKLSISKVSSNVFKLQISDKLSSIATYLSIRATASGIGAAICAYIPGAQAGALALAIMAALDGLMAYLLDKYGGKRKVYLYAKVKYEIKTIKYTYWIVWPYLKGKITKKVLYIKNITTGWGLS